MVPSSPTVADPREGGIRISITNQRGQRYRYFAQAVTLKMTMGMLQVVEDDGGCYAWFDHCDIKVRDTRRTLLFRLKAGAASNLRGAELAILAEFVPPPNQTKTHRQTFAPFQPTNRAASAAPGAC